MQLELGFTQFPFSVVVSSRSKRMRIVLSEEGMQVRVPRGTSRKRVDAFVLEQHDWICRARASIDKKKEIRPLPIRWGPGSRLLRWGKSVDLVFRKWEDERDAQLSRVIVEDGENIIVRLPQKKAWHQCEKQIQKAVMDLLRSNLQVQLSQWIDMYSDLFAKPKHWKWINGRSRWGYCTSDGMLGFHWKLIFCPKDVVEYVVVHEMAHLMECNHSARFWGLVRGAMPEYKKRERWLKQQGSMLR